MNARAARSPISEQTTPPHAVGFATKCEAAKRPNAKFRRCRECGERFQSKRAGTEFCQPSCRRNFHNRQQVRGAQFFSLVMALRFDRDAAKASGAWRLLCRLAAAAKAADDAERAGRRSWDDAAAVRARNPALAATVVGVNVAGTRAGTRKRRLP
jgi:hypothetical protein